MPTETRVLLSQDVLAEQLSDETVLLDMRSGSYFGLSPVASEFWHALEQGSTLEQAYLRLLDEFDVAPETLQRDLAMLMQKLEDNGLVSRRVMSIAR